MFQSARIKLTLWYVLITMTVSIIFSCALFFVLHRELERNLRRFALRQQIIQNYPLPPNLPRYQINVEENDLLERAIALRLVWVNVLVLGIAALAGYFLAGRALRPIKDMVDDQNRFVAAASHEFRTPLTALETAIEVNLRDKKLDLTQAKNVLKENLIDVNRLKKLSNNLLTLVSLKGADKSTAMTNVSLKKIVEEAAGQVAAMAREKGITVKIDVPDLHVAGFQDRLLELFVIFLDNGIKYSLPKTKIHVLAKKIDSSIKITIKDEGLGIDTKDLPHIFERFYRADQSRPGDKTGGYGLGLSIAKEIVVLHHGTIAVSSHLTKGTTFTITLPTSV